MLGTRTPPTTLTTLTRLVALLLPVVALVVGGLTAPAQAATPALTLTGPPPAQRGSTVALVATLSGVSPAAGQQVSLQKQTGNAWTTVTTAPTGSDGKATLSTTLDATTTYRAVTAGDAPLTSPTVTVRAWDARTSLALTAPSSAYVDSSRSLIATLTRDDTSAPVAGQPVRLERLTAGSWESLGTATTTDAGRAGFTVTVQPSGNTFRAVYDGRWTGSDDLLGATSDQATTTPRRRATTLTVTGPAKIVDETSVPLTLTWKAGNGAAVPGTVVLQRRLGSGDWTRYASVPLGADGVATVRVSPRVDSRWRASGPQGRWWMAATSAVKALDNVPPGTPVAYPKDAPRPAVKIAPNARATGAGPNAVVSRISDAVWRSMVGRSWHSGCPVGRSQLRLVRVNYWGYDGYRYRGEIVLRDSVAGRGAAMFSSMYRQKLPIYRMFRVDRFGYSSYLHGGDDYRSMRAGNTSGFNCRGVTGNPGVTSPHSYGRSIDLNTWENPYRSKRGLVPNSWWQYHSNPRMAWRTSSHPVVRTMKANGFRWTYGLGDTQHFDG